MATLLLFAFLAFPVHARQTGAARQLQTMGGDSPAVPFARAADSRSASDGALSSKGRRLMDKTWIYMVDGDTISYGPRGSGKAGIKRRQLRIAGIDTPEVHHYGAGKFEDQEYGPEATKAGRAIIKAAGKVEYIDLGLDKYGRTLVYLFVDDKSYEVEMIKEGLAWEYISTYGDSGYPEIGKAIRTAAAKYPRKPFEFPHDWRGRMWSPEREAAQLQTDLSRRRIRMNKSRIVYDDGDTITYNGKTFRFATIDTPEIMHPEDGIMQDQPYGRKAAAFTENAFRNARTLEYIPGCRDKYGRTLALFFVDGQLFSEMIIKAGLAYENVSIFGPGDTPGFARMALSAFRSLPHPPPFENPMEWRSKNQIKPKE
ncbi:MAG: thermonuclease family protein [Elusimicrobiales bacterium]